MWLARLAEAGTSPCGFALLPPPSSTEPTDGRAAVRVGPVSRGYPRCQILELPSMSPSVRVDTAPIAIR